MGLITILPGTEVDANDLDFNFKELEQQISAGLEEINNLVEHTTYSLTALQNQIVDNKNTTDGQNSSLTESLNALNTANSSKLDLDLNNVSNEAGTKIMSIINPDYTAGYSISSGWEATEAGWIYVRHHQSSDNQTINLKIDNVTVFQAGGHGGYSGGDVDCIQLFIGVGSTVSLSGKGDTTMKFFPCKGVE